MRGWREERGQVVGLTAILLTAMLGLTALVVDAGVWFRADRERQATADAAALAGAQELPDDPAAAISSALEYAGRNGGGVSAADVQITTRARTNDTITVTARGTAQGVFSRLFGIFSVEVAARASSRSAVLTGARSAAPIGVNDDHPLLRCAPTPCFGDSTTLELANLKVAGSADAAGSFGIVNLDPQATAPASTPTVADWIRNGYDGILPLGDYRAGTGAKFNSSDVEAALAERTGDELLLPVYSTVAGSGSNAMYTVIGWVGFVVTGFTGSGDSGTLTGFFTRVTWDGLESTNAAAPDFGARTILLEE